MAAGEGSPGRFRGGTISSPWRKAQVAAQLLAVREAGSRHRKDVQSTRGHDLSLGCCFVTLVSDNVPFNWPVMMPGEFNVCGIWRLRVRAQIGPVKRRTRKVPRFGRRCPVVSIWEVEPDSSSLTP
jgi:hypothetical protein